MLCGINVFEARAIASLSLIFADNLYLFIYYIDVHSEDSLIIRSS